MKHVLMAGVAVFVLASPAAFAQRDAHHTTAAAQLTQFETRDRDRDRDRDSSEVRGTPHWARGDRLPEEYRAGRYAVEDWRAIRLTRPPRGFHWVHVGDRFMLVADRSGMIREFRMEAELRH